MDGFLREELFKLRLRAGASLACMRKAGGSVAIRVSDRAEKGGGGAELSAHRSSSTLVY